MKKYISGLLAIIFASLFMSCSKEDSPFVGSDSFVVSFSITHDSVVYPARINNKEIIIDVLAGIDLFDAKAEYKLSENATIFPEPESIDDWNEDYSFRIQAYNGSFTQYTYRVNRIDVEDENSVVLLSQADVDKFSDLNTTVIKGNLIIGDIQTTTPITNIDALADITKVDGTIFVRQSYAGENLDGFENLKKLGSLMLKDTQKQISVNLPNLKSAGNITIETDSLVQLNMPRLKNVNNFSVNSKKLNKLDLSSLALVSGNFILKAIKDGKYDEANSNVVLRRIDLPKLETVLGTLWFENFWGVATINANKLKSIGEDFRLRYIRKIKSISILALESVAGNTEIFANDNMEKLSIPALKNTGSLFISSVNSYSVNLLTIDFAELVNVDQKLELKFFAGNELSFPKLQKIGVELNLRDLLFLEKLDIAAIQLCPTLIVWSVPMLESLDVSKAELKDVTLRHNTSLNNIVLPENIDNLIYYRKNDFVAFPDFGNLIRINQKLDFGNFTGEELIIDKIEYIGSLELGRLGTVKKMQFKQLKSMGQLIVFDLDELETFEAPKLSKVDGFLFSGNFNLEHIVLSKLEEITGAFIFYGVADEEEDSLDAKITNLNAFASLTKAESVEIKFAGHLNDFSGMKNVVGSLENESKWMVEGCAYNPTYQQMLDGEYTPN